MSAFQMIILATCALALGTEAAVIRTGDDGNKDVAVEMTTVSAVADSATEEPEVATTIAYESHLESEVAALTKDEEASILIFDQSLFDSKSSDLKQSEAEIVQIERTGKLLLLSTPKLGEKAKVPEETAEESEEFVEFEEDENSTDVTLETATTTDSTGAELQTTSTVPDKENENLEKPKEEKSTTKLYPINYTLYEDNKKVTLMTEVPEVPAVEDEQPNEIRSSNLAAILLAEDESDYVLIEADLVEEGPYADIESDLHLQPIVQSVEIVPTSVDDSLLVNYVHTF